MSLRILLVALYGATFCQESVGFTVRTPATSAYFKKYRENNVPADYDIVANGGWYALEKKSTAELAAKNFAQMKPYLPEDLNIIDCGGYYALQQLAADPKGEMLNILKESAKSGKIATNSERLEGTVGLLKAQGQGFESDIVDGEWLLVMQRQGKKSAKTQKLVGKVQKKIGKTSSDFDVDTLKFQNDVSFWKGLGQLSATVQYQPTADSFETRATANKKNEIVLRRISCDIANSSFKFWKLPKAPLPLRRKGGYLDFTYLDEDIRITTGNRGGMFVHARPHVVKDLIAA